MFVIQKPFVTDIIEQLSRYGAAYIATLGSMISDEQWERFKTDVKNLEYSKTEGFEINTSHVVCYESNELPKVKEDPRCHRIVDFFKDNILPKVAEALNISELHILMSKGLQSMVTG